MENSPAILAGQSSNILSLTLDEIQLKSGKPFGSMNMDEFLANLWTSVDESPPAADERENNPAIPHDGTTAATARQGSFSIPVPLSKKTVDEVWFEIQKGIVLTELDTQPSENNNDNNDDNNNDKNGEGDMQRQQTLGEITLEDFLVKAGVVQDPSSATGHATLGNLGFCGQNPNSMVNGYNNSNSNNNRNPIAYTIFNQGECSRNIDERVNINNNCMQADFDGFRIKKRIIDGPPEVLMERRQRRMIKNRESAARSRARKQAYTVELELELNHLTEENLKLKKIVEENEAKRKQEVMKRKQQIVGRKNLEKLRRIRRIVSVGW